jgi:hypothetical protein
MVPFCSKMRPRTDSAPPTDAVTPATARNLAGNARSATRGATHESTDASMMLELTSVPLVE